MHRSGTSALSGVLHRLGVNFGDKLLPAIKGVNEKGFYEHAGAVEINEKMLHSLGSSWLDVRPFPDNWQNLQEIHNLKDKIRVTIENEFRSSVLWGVKDPRLCRLLPIWLDVLESLEIDPVFIIAIRCPDEVVASLCLRDGMDREYAYCLWLRYTLEAELFSRPYPRVVVNYSNLLNSWKATISSIAQALNINWPRSLDEARLQIERFLDPKLRHHKSFSSELSGDFSRISHQVFNGLKEGRLDKCKEGFDEFKSIIDAKSRYLNQKVAIQMLNSEKACLKRMLEAEKANAAAQIEYRDKLVAKLEEQLAAERANAAAQIEYRDKLVAELEEQLVAEKANAAAQIEYRDKLVAKLEEQLSSRKSLLKLLIKPMNRDK
ncbi:MAG: hypothetical protein D6732_26635 [Methanobacteriota archaeon]|nr:MAG: hypothetical protein D6732_26635 [Euryarchaeota archaeon]